MRKAIGFQKVVGEDAARERASAVPDFVNKYFMLNDIDRAKAKAYLDGLLSADKYYTQTKNA